MEREMSSPAFDGRQALQHLIHHPVEFARLSAHPMGCDPLIKVLLPHEQLAFYTMMRQRMGAIHQTISKPAHRAARIRCQRLQIEIPRLRDNDIHVILRAVRPRRHGLSWDA